MGDIPGGRFESYNNVWTPSVVQFHAPLSQHKKPIDRFTQ